MKFNQNDEEGIWANVMFLNKRLPEQSATHTLNMSLPDLLISSTSSPSSFSSSLPVCCLLLAAGTTLLTRCSSLFSDKLHPWNSEMSIEGKRGRDRAEAEGRKKQLGYDFLVFLLLLWGSGVGAEKPDNKHQALRSKSHPKCLLVCHYWAEAGKDKRLNMSVMWGEKMDWMCL